MGELPIPAALRIPIHKESHDRIKPPAIHNVHRGLRMPGQNAAADGKRSDRDPAARMGATHAIECEHDERQPRDGVHMIDVPQPLQHLREQGGEMGDVPE